MDINNVVTTNYPTTDADTRVSKLTAHFEDSSTRAVVVMDDGEVLGVVTRRQFLSSHRNPEAKVKSLVWHVPTVAPGDDVREVAGLMRDSDSGLLPVENDGTLVGAVTVDDIVRAVRPALEGIRVSAVTTADPITFEPSNTVGEAINRFRTEHISHLPIVENGSPVGVLSLMDVVPFTARKTRRAQGGSSGFEPTGTNHGGFGSREGDSDRLLDVPVRDFMSTPVVTAEPTDSLGHAVDMMLDHDVSSVVVVEDGKVVGIATTSDLLDALVREAPGRRAVQVYGMDLLDDISYEEVVDLIEGTVKDAPMSLLDAKVHLHEHDETLRGTPLLYARMRLFTDDGRFIASGEGYGAAQAIADARDAVRRQLIDDKTYAKSKKHMDPEEKAKMRGWETGAE
ncbi:CBS domain-containing protein [Haloarchaeobius sp. TZWSO28]|uniref:CBS domain-containing protein n=1 Tax=Haloarchaeobius sp. TZWSO28 TaxID=3446119 RepID=UPI003EBED5D2